jgi:hypothetical protein
MPTQVATLITAAGETVDLALHEPFDERLVQMTSLVGGPIEAIAIDPARYMLIHGHEKNGCHAHNRSATEIARAAQAIPPYDYIAGTALVVPKVALEP